ncbi:MAG TPA: GspH/FimT family pseudopilin [Methylomirabilota bacterium]|nr:GspH/FimT family pseudopilin [Methylomirabilota bacterium]
MTTRPDGFSLMELALVLAILAAAAAVAAPGIARTADGIRARTERGAVAGVLRAARALAVSRQEPVDVRLDGDGSALIVSVAGGDPALLATRALTRISVSGTPRVTFYPHGTSSGARWAVAAPGAGGSLIVVDALTGRVAVSRSGP